MNFRKFFLITAIAVSFIACNNSKNQPEESNTNETAVKSEAVSADKAEQSPAASSGPGISYNIEGTTIDNYASILVTKEKKMQANEPFLCVLTSNAAKNNNEYLALNFLLDTKPGTYPVVGSSLQRGKSPNDEMYGGMLGGQPKMTDYKVTITECKDLGENGSGGHKWSISGTCDFVVIKATGVMLLDKSKKHPAEIKIEKIAFKDLTFDDNWDEMMKNAFKKK